MASARVQLWGIGYNLHVTDDFIPSFPSGVRARRHRLAPDLYRGFVGCTFTICVQKGSASVAEARSAEIVRGAIDSLVSRGSTHVTAYVLMPDHMHVVLTGVTKDADLLKDVMLLKQATARGFILAGIPITWQKGSFDHIHRRDDDIVRHVLYLVQNPVRKGLVNEWREWPFLGAAPFPIDTVLP